MIRSIFPTICSLYRKALFLIQYNHSPGKTILQKEDTDMALSVDSKVKELMKNEAAQACRQ